jgi:transcriptional regulator with XRE-family HTH domain
LLYGLADAKRRTVTGTLMSGFGDELARLIAARGVGVRELARRVPCNPGHLSNVKNGNAKPSRELARALDTALGAGGASLRWLMTGRCSTAASARTGASGSSGLGSIPAARTMPSRSPSPSSSMPSGTPRTC